MPRHACQAKKKNPVTPDRCSACRRGIPLPDTSKPEKEVMHFCRFLTAMCGVVGPKGRVIKDRLVTCEACLLKRLEISGVGFPSRALLRAAGNDPTKRLEMLQGALKNISRLRVWQHNSPLGRKSA